MRPLAEKYPESPDHQCFGCSQKNSHGLRMEFYEDGDTIVSFWKPQPWIYGHGNTLSGGLLSALCDECASWVLIDRLKLEGVTIKLHLKVRRHPVMAQKLTIKAVFSHMKLNIAVIRVLIEMESGEPLAEADVQFYTLKDIHEIDKIRSSK